MSKRIAIIFLFILSIIPLFDLLHDGLPVTHDGQDHVARIANFYQSLSEGNIVPRWAANLNWGYGHPILMFLYPLPSYLASVFHFFGFSFVDSAKLVFAVSFVASIIAMFFWLSEEWGVPAGFVGALLYGFAPYRFVDLYVRGAIGEHMGFVFPPLILLGLLWIAKKKTSYWPGVLVSLSTAGLILSHNAVSLMFLPIIILYIVYLYFVETKKDPSFLVKSIIFVSFGFILSAFFWIPAFFEGKYTLRDIVTQGGFHDRFTDFGWFFYSPWNYGGGSQFTKSFGLLQWFIIPSGLFIFLKLNSAKTKLYIFGCILILMSSIFMMTAWSSGVWDKISLLQKFQFPWRLLTLCVFATSIIGAIVVNRISKRFLLLMTGVVSLFLMISTVFMWHARSYNINPQEFYSGIYNGTTDTGESSPIWSIRFMEKRPAAPAEVIDGDAKIIFLNRSTTKHRYTIEANRRTRIAENTLYFPGWDVLVDGRLVQLEFQDPRYRGLMTYYVDPGNHSVDVVFKDTRLRMLANEISVLGVGLLLISAIIPIWKRK